MKDEVQACDQRHNQTHTELCQALHGFCTVLRHAIAVTCEQAAAVCNASVASDGEMSPTRSEPKRDTSTMEVAVKGAVP